MTEKKREWLGFKAEFAPIWDDAKTIFGLWGGAIVIGGMVGGFLFGLAAPFILIFKVW